MVRRVTYAVVGLLLVSGCAAIPSVGNTESPPGVEDGTLTNTSALVNADMDARGDQYALVHDYEYTVDGNATTERLQLTVDDNAAHYRVETTDAGETTISEGYENATFTADWNPNSSVPEFTIESTIGVNSRHGAASLYSFLDSISFERTGTTTHDGTPVTVLHASSVDDDAQVDYTLQDARMLVDGDGLVHRLTYTLESTSRYDRYEHTFELEKNSGTDVDSPDWIEEAKAELPTPDIDVRATDDGYVEITHDGGPTFDPMIYADSRILRAEQFSDGDELYVGRDGEFAVSASKPPSPVDDTVTIKVYGTATRVDTTVNATV